MPPTLPAQLVSHTQQTRVAHLKNGSEYATGLSEPFKKTFATATSHAKSAEERKPRVNDRRDPVEGTVAGGRLKLTTRDESLAEARVQESSDEPASNQETSVAKGANGSTVPAAPEPVEVTAPTAAQSSHELAKVDAQLGHASNIGLANNIGVRRTDSILQLFTTVATAPLGAIPQVAMELESVSLVKATQVDSSPALLSSSVSAREQANTIEASRSAHIPESASASAALNPEIRGARAIALPTSPAQSPQNAATVQVSMLQDQNNASSQGYGQPAGHQGGNARASDEFSTALQSQASPASARASEIDASVRLENLTFQRSVLQPAPTTAPALIGHQFSLTDAQKGIATAQQWPFPNAPIEETPVAGQIVRGLATMVNQRGGVMNMRLDPPDLGELRVQVTLTRGTISAEFHPASQQAQALLEKSLAMLRSTLENHGLNVERLTVHLASTTGQAAVRDDGNSSNTSQQRQDHNAAGGESRGRRDGQQQHTTRDYPLADFATIFDGFDGPIS